jgi:predicted outer membrane repeat protein
VTVNKHLTKKPIVVTSGASVVTLIGGGLAVGGQAVTAADYTATDQSTLADAITAANANPGADTITIAEGTITLTEALPVIDDELTIIGAGEGVTVLDGAGAYRIFRATGAYALTISDMTLQNGFAGIDTASGGSGGAVLAERTSLTLENVTMSNNYARLDGGAVEVTNNTFPPQFTLDISDSTFDSNRAVNTPAVDVNGFISSVTISNSTFTDNTSSNGFFGTGALTVACSYYCDVTLSDSVFAYNKTEYGGVGAAYIYAGYGGSVTIERSTFEKNTVTGSEGVGAVLVSYTSEVTIDESSFTGNTTAGYTYGGALTLLSSASATITTSTFTSNSTGGSGGALWTSGVAELSIADSTFAYNEAAFAGGLYVYAADSVTIANTTFNSNSATNRGGAINAFADSVIVDQSTLSGNAGGSAGAMRLYATQAVIRNSTIATNTSDSGAAVLADKSEGALAIINTVISANTAGADENDDLLTTDLTSTQLINCLIGVENTSGSRIVNNLITSTDPGLGPLGDNGGNTATMVPLPGSPLIDAGTQLVASFATDQRGAPRFVDVIDIGAVEAQPAPPETTTTVPETTLPDTTLPDTTLPDTTLPDTTDPVASILPPTGGSGRTGVTAALLTALGAALTLGASRRGKLRS